MVIKDAWTTFLEVFREKLAIERKRKQYGKLTRQNLNYTLIEEMIAAASKQAPGFYSLITFPDGTKWEFGRKATSERRQGEAF